MPAPIFVDTSAWIALVHARDQAHERAALTWQALQAARREPVTTSLVIAESHGLISRRIGVDAGLRFLDSFAGGQAHHVVWVDQDLTGQAVALWLRRYRDHPFSLTDAASFAVMEREGLRDAFTFDLDFERAGFTCVAGE